MEQMSLSQWYVENSDNTEKKNEVFCPVHIDRMRETANRITQLENALRDCHEMLNVAFDYDGDVFGMSHNKAVDVDVIVRTLLENKK